MSLLIGIAVVLASDVRATVARDVVANVTELTALEAKVAASWAAHNLKKAAQISSSSCESMGVTDHCCTDAFPHYACKATTTCGRGVCLPAESTLCGCSGTHYCGATSGCCGSTCCNNAAGYVCTGSTGSCECTRAISRDAAPECGAAREASCDSSTSHLCTSGHASRPCLTMAPAACPSVPPTQTSAAPWASF